MYYTRAFALDRASVENVERIYELGSRLGRWEDMKSILEEFIAHRPGHISAIVYSAAVCCRLGDYGKAEELVNKGVLLSGDNPDLKEIRRLIKEAREDGWKPAKGLDRAIADTGRSAEDSGRMAFDHAP